LADQISQKKEQKHGPTNTDTAFANPSLRSDTEQLAFGPSTRFDPRNALLSLLGFSAKLLLKPLDSQRRAAAVV